MSELQRKSRSKKIAGTDRYNLMLSLVGFLIHNRDVELAELAEHFQVSIDDTRDALETISMSGIKSYGGGELFDFGTFEFDDSTPVNLQLRPAIDAVPRVSQRQAAAISAGLKYLLALDDFAEKQQVEELLQILASGVTSGGMPEIEIKPGTPAAEVVKVRKAIATETCLEFEYHNSKGEVKLREIEPLHLSISDDGWILRGYSQEESMVKAFRVDRMRGARLLDRQVSQKAKDAEITEEIYVPNATDIEVTVDVYPEAQRLLSQFNAEDVVTNSSTGLIRGVIKIGHLPDLGRIIAQHGGLARVVSPQSAREVVRDFALRALGEKGLSQHSANQE
jgi:proteasome accessory factor C